MQGRPTPVRRAEHWGPPVSREDSRCPSPLSPFARRRGRATSISVLLAALVLALVLVAVGGRLVMSAASSPVPTHASVAAPHDSGGSNRARLPQ